MISNNHSIDPRQSQNFSIYLNQLNDPEKSIKEGEMPFHFDISLQADKIDHLIQTDNIAVLQRCTLEVPEVAFKSILQHVEKHRETMRTLFEVNKGLAEEFTRHLCASPKPLGLLKCLVMTMWDAGYRFDTDYKCNGKGLPTETQAFIEDLRAREAEDNRQFMEKTVLQDSHARDALLLQIEKSSPEHLEKIDTQQLEEIRITHESNTVSEKKIKNTDIFDRNVPLNFDLPFYQQNHGLFFSKLASMIKGNHCEALERSNLGPADNVIEQCFDCVEQYEKSVRAMLTSNSGYPISLINHMYGGQVSEAPLKAMTRLLLKMGHVIDVGAKVSGKNLPECVREIVQNPMQSDSLVFQEKNATQQVVIQSSIEEKPTVRISLKKLQQLRQPNIPLDYTHPIFKNNQGLYVQKISAMIKANQFDALEKSDLGPVHEFAYICFHYIGRHEESVKAALKSNSSHAASFVNCMYHSQLPEDQLKTMTRLLLKMGHVISVDAKVNGLSLPECVKQIVREFNQ